jgi:hypothetical protein
MPTDVTIFDRLLARAAAEGRLDQNVKASVNWMRQKAQQVGKVHLAPSKFMQDDHRTRTIIQPGDMYMFSYDPKLKKTLPYYDRFPIIFPLRMYNDGFLGVNFHYLPLTYRARLMDALMTDQTTTPGKITYETKMKASYQILNAASKYRWFKPTIKRYLANHVKSRFIYIFPEEWQIALWLPTARWSKASEEEVFRDSRRIIRNS